MSDADDALEEERGEEKAPQPRRNGFAHALRRIAGNLFAAVTNKLPSDNAARLTAWATAIIAAFTILSAVVSYMQWREIHESSKQTDQLIDLYRKQVEQLSNQANQTKALVDQTSEQARQSGNIAGRTEDTLRNNIKSFQDAHRAWLGIVDTSTKEFDESNGWIASIAFFNSGNTPARNVELATGIMTASTPQPGPSQADIDMLVFNPRLSVAPQSRMNVVISNNNNTDFIKIPDAHPSKPRTIASYKDIKEKKAIIYYYGSLRYDDIYGNHRSTNYCIYLANPDTKSIFSCNEFTGMN